MMISLFAYNNTKHIISTFENTRQQKDSPWNNFANTWFEAITQNIPLLKQITKKKEIHWPYYSKLHSRLSSELSSLLFNEEDFWKISHHPQFLRIQNELSQTKKFIDKHKKTCKVWSCPSCQTTVDLEALDTIIHFLAKQRFTITKKSLTFFSAQTNQRFYSLPANFSLLDPVQQKREKKRLEWIQLTLFFASIFGKENIYVSNVGLNSHIGIHEQLRYLDEFAKQYPSNSPFTVRLNSTISILKKAEQSAQHHYISMVHIANKNLDKASQANVYEAIRIFKELSQASPSKKGQASLTLVPGGYLLGKGKNGKGHAVLYEIEKHENNLFSFSIINTGIGLERHDTAWKINGFSLPQHRYQSKIYRSLTLEDLSPTLLYLLISSSNGLLPITMSQVYKLIHLRLYKGKNLERGRCYKEQRFGTCWYKSVSSWLHGVLGNDLYNLFKAYMTNKVIENFRKEFKINGEYRKLTENTPKPFFKKLKGNTLDFLNSSFFYLGGLSYFGKGKRQAFMEAMDKKADAVLKRRNKKALVDVAHQ